MSSLVKELHSGEAQSSRPAPRPAPSPTAVKRAAAARAASAPRSVFPPSRNAPDSVPQGASVPHVFTHTCSHTHAHAFCFSEGRPCRTSAVQHLHAHAVSPCPPTPRAAPPPSTAALSPGLLGRLTRKLSWMTGTESATKASGLSPSCLSALSYLIWS